MTSKSRITVRSRDPGKQVSPTMFGLFFEDINFGADGGLYAERIQNRSFEHDDALFSWSGINRGGEGELSVQTEAPLNENNTHFLRLTVRKPGNGFGVTNAGFDGIPVQAGERLRFSIYARSGQNIPLVIRLEDSCGRPFGESRIDGLGESWQKFSTTIRSAHDEARARLVIIATEPGQVDLDMVSLFPEKTWKNRENGLRDDLAKLLAEIRPGFLRFPGGCIVEGKDLANAYRWKETVGDVAGRRQNWNRWMTALPEAPAPHYHQTYGLGFFEYFQWCEDLGAEAVPILNCGMSCQFQDKEFVPEDELEPFLRDMLDLIEFANGPTDSPWGRKRAEMGHPEPFGLKYLGIGNEQWGGEYFKRYPYFYDALKSAHPEIQLITTAGPAVDGSGYVPEGGELWKLAWDKFKGGVPADIVDEHYYCTPEWFLEHAHRYEKYDPDGPKIFAGEYAAHGTGRRNDLKCALAEAALLTGLLRSCDVVVMAAYAPLLARAGFTQWAPDLIWFDPTRAFGTPSYYVQKLFSRNRPDTVIPVAVEHPRPKELFAVAGRSAESGELILFVVNVTESAIPLAVEMEGMTEDPLPARMTILTSAGLSDENSFEHPEKVSPVEESLVFEAPHFEREFPARSLTVLRFSQASKGC